MARNTAKPKRKTSPMRVLMYAAVGFAALYLLTTLVSGRLQVGQKEQELASIQLQTQQQQDTNAELQEILDSGDEDAYVERVAREKLGYARPDERVFVDISGQ